MIPLEAVRWPVTVVTSVVASPRVTAASKVTACSKVTAAPAKRSSSVPSSSYSIDASPFSVLPNISFSLSGIIIPSEPVIRLDIVRFPAVVEIVTAASPVVILSAATDVPPEAPTVRSFSEISFDLQYSLPSALT